MGKIHFNTSLTAGVILRHAGFKYIPGRTEQCLWKVELKLTLLEMNRKNDIKTKTKVAMNFKFERHSY